MRGQDVKARGNKNANAGKCLEREVARIVGGARFWSNSGESVDIESDRFVIQAKHVKTMSLGAMTRLALQAEADAKKCGKIGVCAAKLRLGFGKRSPILFLMTSEEFKRLIAGGSGGRTQGNLRHGSGVEPPPA